MTAELSLRDRIALIIRRDAAEGISAESTADAIMAEGACAALDLAWLLDAGWLAQLGQSRASDESPAGYYASVRHMGTIVSVNFTGDTVGRALAKAREWAEEVAS